MNDKAEPAKPDNDAIDDRMATAFHEAGHAVMAVLLGRSIQKVTIEPAKMMAGEKRLGSCQLQKKRAKSSNDWLEDEVLILFAGMVAESHFTGKYCVAGASADLRSIGRLIRSRPGSARQLERIERRFLDKTEHILRDDGHAAAIQLVATELIAKTTISGRAVRHFIDQAIQQNSR
ncbi:ATP-dependent zinc metalloprotease FtsH [Rubripirellula tenax]|uniref:ATP-dependent zinc metalloprotease FtsH n=1 Tax=Rubripirellula tenax TaxID=2528015 RepID=A0A5C6F7R7_9BACT|nr:M50 family metallopeptidase [Rubripirellula tenax]TWU56620.1 ATP-dependent zinc metalloprotease FtsH [Rubripirellula tenax]